MARHQEQVRAGLDLVRQRVIVSEAHGDARRMPRRHRQEQFFVLRFARAQRRQIITFGYQVVGGLGDQAGALLAGEARDDADQGRVHGFRRQPKLVHQVLLANTFAAQIGGGIMRRDEGIGLRIPFRIVHAVQNAGKRLAPRPQHAVQSEAIFRSLNLAGVGGTDRVQRIGIVEPALQITDFAEELQPVRTELLASAEPDIGHGGGGKKPVVSHVVNGEQRAYAQERRIVAIDSAQISRRQPRLPIVRMQDIGPPHAPAELERRLRQDRETDVIIGIVLAVFAIEAGAVVQRRVVQEIERRLPLY